MKAAITIAIAVLLFASSPAHAQSWEASALLGLTPSAAIDRKAPELDTVDVGSAFTWGAQAARFFTPSLGAEVIWTRAETALEIGTAAGKADLFSMTVKQLHGNVVYQLGQPNARWRPFVFGGLGATFFSAATLDSETKFSMDVGGGVKYFPWSDFGVRAHFRYKPTFLKDTSSGDFCDPFGFCQGSLPQIEIAGAVVWRF